MAEEAIKEWYAIRIRAIHDRVEAHDVLRSNGVQFRNSGDREEQFSCPFHGKDEKPSARVYPTNAQSPSHVWCYVCRERWDVIGLWQKYHGGSFHKVLSEIEKYYNLQTPPVPEGALNKGLHGTDLQKAEFETLYKACESRLIGERDSYDMRSYLVAGSIMDKAVFQIGSGHLSYADGAELMKKLMQKIGEKVRGVQPSKAADT